MIVSSETVNDNLNKMRTVILANPVDVANININNNNENHIERNGNQNLKRKYTTYVHNAHPHPVNCDSTLNEPNNGINHLHQQQEQQEENDMNNITSNDIYKTAKKTFDSYNYNDYHQHQNHHYEILNDNANFHNQSIEFVNVTYDNNLLPVQNPIISEHNSLSMNELNTTWGNSELIDLDSRQTLNLDTNDTSTNNKLMLDSIRLGQDNSFNAISNNNTNSASNLQHSKDLSLISG